VAVRWRNHPTEQPPSLCAYPPYNKRHDRTDFTPDVSTTAGITLNRKYPKYLDGGDPTKAVKGGSGEHLEQREWKLEKEEHELHVIVASEPTTFRPGEWTLLDKNHGEFWLWLRLDSADSTGSFDGR
jgi:glutamine amidotransferase